MPTELSDKTMRTRFGDMLSLYCHVHKVSLRQLAKEIGVGHATLSRISYGKPMDVHTLLKVVAWMIGEQR